MDSPPPPQLRPSSSCSSSPPPNPSAQRRRPTCDKPQNFQRGKERKWRLEAGQAECTDCGQWFENEAVVKNHQKFCETRKELDAWVENHNKIYGKQNEREEQRPRPAAIIDTSFHGRKKTRTGIGFTFGVGPFRIV